MNEGKLTVELTLSPELMGLLKSLIGAQGVGGNAQPPQQAAPVQQVAPSSQPQPPITPPVVQTQPPQVTAPVAQTVQPTYTLDTLANAAAAIIGTKRQELTNLLAQFNVDSLPNLQKEQYGAFATALRGLGAVI